MMEIKLAIRLFLAVVACVLIGVTGCTLRVNSGLRDDLRASKAQVASLEDARRKDAAADKVKVQATTKATKAHVANTQALQKAYDEHEDWANQPVPSDVAAIGMR